MYALPEALFTPTDVIVAALCVVMALLFAVLPQFAKHWDCHWAERLVLGSIFALMAFATPILLVDVPNLTSTAGRSALFWMMPWLCLAAHLVAVGAGYARHAAVQRRAKA